MELTKQTTSDGQQIYSDVNPFTKKAMYAVKGAEGEFVEIKGGAIGDGYKDLCRVDYDHANYSIVEQHDKARFIVVNNNSVIGIHRADVLTKAKDAKTTPRLTISHWKCSGNGKWSNYHNTATLQPSSARVLGKELLSYADEHSPVSK